MKIIYRIDKFHNYNWILKKNQNTWNRDRDGLNPGSNQCRFSGFYFINPD